MVQYGAKQGKKIHHDTRQTAGFQHKLKPVLIYFKEKKMLGRTNAVSKSGGGSGGNVIQAVNRTGNLINSGDKVWINKDTLASGEHFEVYYKSPVSVIGEISPDGTLAVVYNKIYEVGSNSATEIYTIPTSYNLGYFIQEENNLFYQDFSSNGGFIRIGNDTTWSESLIRYRYLGNGLAFYYNSSNSFIAKIDIETGKVLYQSETISVGNGTYRCIFINNIFINSISGKKQAWLVTDTGSSIELTAQNPTNSLSSDLYTKGLFTTIDNKYILGRSSSVGSFKIVSYDINTSAFTEYDMASVFPELMEWVNNTSFQYCFDRESGLLTFASTSSNSYAVFKYENGRFNKLVVELPNDITVTNFNCQIGITRDLSRISFINDYEYPNCNLNIASLTNDERYLLQSNAYYNIGETTLTGKANQDIPSGQTGEVSTVL